MPKVPSVWTVLSMLEWATEFFAEKEVKSPRLSIEWLLAYVLSAKRLDLYLAYDRPLSTEELADLKPLIKRRALHEPLQYITGETDFHQVKMKVEPGVLIPRQETEQLVELILQNHKEESALKVLDIGTGSGCIPIALKNSRTKWEVFATDVSSEALGIARQNAELNKTDVNFAEDDIFTPQAFPKEMKFDLIISNPPYILPAEKEGLDKEVKLYEPELALFCSSTEKMYGAIEQFSANHLSKNGNVYLELHENYAHEVKAIFESKNWKASLIQDYSEKARFLSANRKK
ncbi:MAG: peptide chain release factor N(5)-glutamine methyltransferase [Balneolaceae bacterium]